VILFYAAQTNRAVEMLEQQLAGYKLTRCRTFHTMKKRLRKPRHGLEIALVVVENVQEIDYVLEIQWLVRDLKLILMLPERNPQMVSQAHKLAPRFIAYADLGPGQIVAVLKKMTEPMRRHQGVSVMAVADF
jgi:hypothetical protein